MKPFYRSKKFWAAVVGIAWTILGPFLDMNPETVAEGIVVVVTFILAVAGADWGKEAKAIETETSKALAKGDK